MRKVFLALVLVVGTGWMVLNFAAPASTTASERVEAEMQTLGRGMCYTNWNADSCAQGFLPVETGVWTTVQLPAGGASTICAEEKSQDVFGVLGIWASTQPDSLHEVSLEPCAVCCR